MMCQRALWCTVWDIATKVIDPQPDAGQVKAQQSYPKDHLSSNSGPMSIASLTTGADGRRIWEAIVSSGRHLPNLNMNEMVDQ